MVYKLKDLQYEYDSLEPVIDEETMRIHHQGHHQAYVDKLNKSVEDFPELQKMSPEELLRNLESLPEEIKQKVINFGGGVVNHDFFWSILKKDSVPGGEILDAINDSFGSFDEFKKQFIESAGKVFGSGWTWLVFDSKLEILNTTNQDSPLSLGKIPLLALDLWEHAFYLKHKNKRDKYISDFFNVINWDRIEENFLEVKK